MPEPVRTDEPASQRQHKEDRMRRAYTWLGRSERTGTEDIERFVFLWIAFNAAYGDESALREFVEGREARETEPDVCGGDKLVHGSGGDCPAAAE